jgi:hypothetical protein
LWQALTSCQRVAAHEGHFHGDRAAVGQAEVLVLLELLDAGEDVVPAPGVEAGGVLAQFVEDFFHLEGGEDGFDQHRGLDRAARQADVVLGHDEDVVPQAGFEVAFHLRQVEEGAGAAGDLLLGVVEEDQREVEDAAGDALTVDGHVLFVEVPAARADLQGGDLVVELVFLAGFVLERQLAADGLVEVDLALDLVVPLRAVGILEVGHVGVGARVVGVDDHLGFDRAGDFGAAAFEGLGQRAIFQSPSRMCLVSGRKSGISPASMRAWRSTRALQQFLAAGSKARCSLATRASASGVRMVS